jgi:hypothetical protein
MIINEKRDCMDKKVCLNCGCECWGYTVYCPSCGQDKFGPVGTYKKKEEVKPVQTTNSFMPRPAAQPIRPQVNQPMVIPVSEEEECFSLAMLLGFLLGTFGVLITAIMTASKPYTIKAVKQSLVGWAISFIVVMLLGIILLASIM